MAQCGTDQRFSPLSISYGMKMGITSQDILIAQSIPARYHSMPPYQFENTLVGDIISDDPRIMKFVPFELGAHWKIRVPGDTLHDHVPVPLRLPFHNHCVGKDARHGKGIVQLTDLPAQEHQSATLRINRQTLLDFSFQRFLEHTVSGKNLQVRFRKSSSHIQRINGRQRPFVKTGDLQDISPLFLQCLQILRIIELESGVTQDADYRATDSLAGTFQSLM